MSSPEQITDRVKKNSVNIIKLDQEIDKKWTAVLIEAWKKDLQILLWTHETPIDKELIHNNQNYLLNIDLWKAEWKRELLEILRKTFRETTKIHNESQKAKIPTVQSIQLEIPFLDIEDASPEDELPNNDTNEVSEAKLEDTNSEHVTISNTEKTSESHESKPKNKGWRPTGSTKKKPQPPVIKIPLQTPTMQNNTMPEFEIPESFKKNSIFWMHNPKPKQKTAEEIAFDAKMRAHTWKQWANNQPKTQQRIPTNNTQVHSIHFSAKEMENIKTLLDAEPVKEIKLWSLISKLDDIKAIHKHYQTLIMHYTEIISIMVNQNQTEKTTIQINYIEECRNELHDIRQYLERMNNNRFIFKANEQKQNILKRIDKIRTTIQLLVTFN